MKFNLPSFENARLVVVGDVMLDRYWYGNTDRISPEAPVPVVHVKRRDERPGGAGNVALNISALGAKVHLIGAVGKDDAARILEQKLENFKVTCSFHQDAQKPTITKLRVLSHNQQLIRMDFEEHTAQNSENCFLLEKCNEYFGQADVVIMSDYGKGSMGQQQQIIAKARQMNIPILVDPKGSDFSIYTGATLLTPNFKEFEAVAGKCDTEAQIVQKGLELIQKYHLQALLVTRGAKGMTLIEPGKPELHLPAKTQEVFDVTGAGDTVIAMLASALAAGTDLTMAVALANRAASISVSKLGAATVSVPELRRSILNDGEASTGFMTQEQLLIAVEDAKAHGETVVMTNGCFDILHAGHVSYLEKAKKLGHRLIVAVNSDDSVARIKGKNRPVNTLEKRMAVLCALSAVDWVVPFTQDTPEQLIGLVLPDILVKGGDYEPQQIVGYDFVTENGGEVKVLDYEAGCSTSGIINKITQEVSA